MSFEGVSKRFMKYVVLLDFINPVFEISLFLYILDIYKLGCFLFRLLIIYKLGCFIYFILACTY